jgi:hypothetical protein
MCLLTTWTILLSHAAKIVALFGLAVLAGCGNEPDKVIIAKAEYEQLKADAGLGRDTREMQNRHRDLPSLFDECENPLPPAVPKRDKSGH